MTGFIDRVIQDINSSGIERLSIVFYDDGVYVSASSGVLLAEKLNTYRLKLIKKFIGYDVELYRYTNHGCDALILTKEEKRKLCSLRYKLQELADLKKKIQAENDAITRQKQAEKAEQLQRNLRL